MSIGPKTTINRSCFDCDVCQSERYSCQGDSGADVYCAHPSLPERRIIGDTQWNTPQWCPAEPEIAAPADARIAELVELLTECRDCVLDCHNAEVMRSHSRAERAHYYAGLLAQVDAVLARASGGGES